MKKTDKFGLLIVCTVLALVAVGAFAGLVTAAPQELALEVDPLLCERSVDPGEATFCRYTITNTGSTDGLLAVSPEAAQELYSPPGWPDVTYVFPGYPGGTTLIGSIPLSAGQAVTMEVRLTVPPTAASGDYTGTLTMTLSAPALTSTQQAVQMVVHVNPHQIYLPLVIRNYPPLWRQAAGTAGVTFYDVALCPANPDVQYAGTGDAGVYRSADGGRSWALWALGGERATPVVVTPDNCDEVYAATWGGGVYRITGQNQAAQANAGLGELYLYALALSDDGQTLYAGTADSGLYQAQRGATLSWSKVSLPASDERIRSIRVQDGHLYVGARNCTYYHSANEGLTWDLGQVLAGGSGAPCNDAQVWSMAELNGVLYAGLDDSGLHRRPSGGAWQPVSSVPAVDVYDLKVAGEHLYVAAHGDGVYACDVTLSCPKMTARGLGNLGVRWLLPFDGILEIATDDGIWHLPISN